MRKKKNKGLELWRRKKLIVEIAKLQTKEERRFLQKKELIVDFGEKAKACTRSDIRAVSKLR